MIADLYCKLEDLEKNIKGWIKEGFIEFKVHITDYDGVINFKIKKEEVSQSRVHKYGSEVPLVDYYPDDDELKSLQENIRKRGDIK